MTLLLKEPQSTLDYSVDWGTHYLAGDLLASSDWTVSPDETGGLAVEQSGLDAAIATVRVAGGIAGRLYRLSNDIVTARGLKDRRTVTIRVEQR
jgi:hypothetical protein